MEGTVPQTGSAAKRRSAIRRSIGLRVVAAAIVISFVCLVGDLRRRYNATTQTGQFAEALNAAIGEPGVIPLNLDPSRWIDADRQPIDMFTLSRDNVACLRRRSQPMMVAWTVRLVQILGVNGRAIVRFQDGRAGSSWVPESQFASLRQAQHEALASCN